MNPEKITADDFGMTRRARPLKADVDAFFEKLRGLDPGRNHLAIPSFPTWGDENQMDQTTASSNQGIQEERVTTPAPNSTWPVKEKMTTRLGDKADSAWETDEGSLTAQGFASTSPSQEEAIKTEEVKGVETETTQAQKSSPTSESEGPTVQTRLSLVNESPSSAWPPDEPEKETVGTQSPDSPLWPNEETTEKQAATSTQKPSAIAGSLDTRGVVVEDFIGNNRPPPDTFAVETFFAKLRQQDRGEEPAGWNGGETVAWNGDETGDDNEPKGWW